MDFLLHRPNKLIIFFSLLMSSCIAYSQPVYSFSVLGQPKYPDNFTHFDYVNPNAPKGGNLTLPAIGTYDNFNRFALRGNPAERTAELYDTLFATSDDQLSTYYPLIAESVTYPDDFQWMDVTINPLARFHDNQPITADDVVFSFEKFMTQGVPQYRSYFKGATVTKISPLKVRFEIAPVNRERLIDLVGGLSIFPKHYWQNIRLEEPISTPPLSSGPYMISDYKLGQYVVYQRVKDYWAKDLPVNKGSYNFDQIRYDYYQDDNVAFEAFKAGAYDIRRENQPKNWLTQYQGTQFDQGNIIKLELENQSAQNTRWLAFNIQRPIFKDRRVRQALSLALDFNWFNKAFYYDANQRTRSYFQNTDYEAHGLPDANELRWLNPLKDQIPAEVFTEEYQPPETDGSGNNRTNLLKAMELLNQAGWSIQNQKLVHKETNKPFEFEIMLLNGNPSPYIMPFKHNLARLGIEITIREVDSSQYLSRMRNRDFDMIPYVYRAFAYPTAGLQTAWGSAYLNSSYNATGLHSAAIDDLLQSIIDNQTNLVELKALGRALDRVLTWHQVMIPLWYSNIDRLAYWNKFAKPTIKPIHTIGINTWWIKEENN